MAEIFSPGVYVEEVATAAQVTTGVTTSNMGILGYAPQGPANEATLVTSYEQYSRIFGGLVATSYMPLSMAAFFANGGTRAYVVRVPPADAVAADAKIQSQVKNYTVFTGDGSAASITGDLNVSDEVGIVPGSASVVWREADTAVVAENARNAGNTADLTLTAGVAAYDGRVNTTNLPAFDSRLDSVVRGTVTLDYLLGGGIGAVSIPVPVGSSSVVDTTVGNSTNGAKVTFDHRSTRFSLYAYGTYAPTAAAATLTTPAGAGATVLTADTAGTAGNAFTLTFVSGAAAALTNVGTAYTYTYVTGVTTVANFETAVGALPAGTFGVSTPSATPAALLTTPAADFGPTNFTGGYADTGVNITVSYTPASETLLAEDGRGKIAVVAGSALTVGDNFSINDGTTTATFEYTTSGVTTVPGATPIPYLTTSTAAEVQAATVVAINSYTGLLLNAVAVTGSTTQIRLVPNSSEAPGAVTLTETVGAGGFSVAPIAPSTDGVWAGDVSAAGALDYALGSFTIPVTGFVPHNKALCLANYTENTWDLNPISVGAWGNGLRVQIVGSPNYYTAATATYSRFDVFVSQYNTSAQSYAVLETFEELVFDDVSSPVFFADVINELSDYITVTSPTGNRAPPTLNGLGYTQVLAGGTGLAANQSITGTLFGGATAAEIQPRTVSITYTNTSGQVKTITDDGYGALTGAVASSGVNTIDYTSGAFNVKTLDLIQSGSVVVATYRAVPSEATHTEDFGSVAKLYVRGEEGTFDDTNWGRAQFTEISALAADYKGLYAFNKVDEILQVVLPDLAGDINVSKDLLDYAFSRSQQPSGGDRFVILTTPSGLSAQRAVDWFRYDLAQYSNYAALYWPWVRVSDPLLNGRPKLMPPLAHIAGVYARTDNSRNVGKSPGGTVDGALVYLNGLETNPTLADRDIVYPNKINPLINSPQTGLAVWGVRTISNVPDWQYINARRLFMYLEKSVFNTTWWAVFENNGPQLWSKLTTQVAGFLGGLFQAGYFAGSSPGQAYFVKCDSSNNTGASIDAGQVIMDIGVAPNKPAEFIRLRFQQKSLNS